MYSKETNEEVDFWGKDDYEEIVDFIEKTINKRTKREL